MGELDSELCSLRQEEARFKKEAWSMEPALRDGAHDDAGEAEAAEVRLRLQKAITINIGLRGDVPLEQSAAATGYVPVVGTHGDAASARLAGVHRDDCAKELKSRLQTEIDDKRKELQTKQSELMEQLGCRRCQASARVGPQSAVQTSLGVPQPDYSK